MAAVTGSRRAEETVAIESRLSPFRGRGCCEPRSYDRRDHEAAAGGVRPRMFGRASSAVDRGETFDLCNLPTSFAGAGPKERTIRCLGNPERSSG